jgi:hypothetical protein
VHSFVKNLQVCQKLTLLLTFQFIILQFFYSNPLSFLIEAKGEIVCDCLTEWSDLNRQKLIKSLTTEHLSFLKQLPSLTDLQQLDSGQVEQYILNLRVHFANAQTAFSCYMKLFSSLKSVDPCEEYAYVCVLHPDVGSKEIHQLTNSGNAYECSHKSSKVPIAFRVARGFLGTFNLQN